MQEKLENKSSVRIPNDKGGPQTNLGSIGYHSEPSEVPYQKKRKFSLFLILLIFSKALSLGEQFS